MQSGLLWYDSDPKKAVEAKIDEAVERYREKFGATPNACHVSLSLTATHHRVRVVGDRWIRPNYFWLGSEELAS